MKIVFIGGVEFSKQTLSYILERGWTISLLCCYDESKKKFYSDYADFDDISKKYNIKQIKIKNINDKENVDIINNINPDLILVIGWSQLLKKEIIQLPKLGVIGSHPTELPKYRGRSPIPWSIIKELKESALTLFYIQEGMDDGDIIDQRKFHILPDDDATSVYNKMIDIGKTMLDENLMLISQGKINRQKQDPKLFLENWPKRSPDDGKINWTKPASEIHKLIRATTHPYPGAFTFYKNSKMTIWKSSFSGQKSSNFGTIIEVDFNGIKVGTGDGILIIHRLSIDGKEKQSSDFFSKNDIGITLGE